MTDKIHIIGIADDGLEGLTSQARELLRNAEWIIGPRKSLAFVHELAAEKIEIGANLDEVMAKISQRESQRTVVLTLGDPLFHGTARYLCERFGKETFEILPHVSMMQLAFARLKESWDEAYLANLASQELPRVIDRVRTCERAGLFTTEQMTPKVIATELLQQGIDYFTAFVCENIGSPDERVTQGTLAEISTQSFSNLNVLVLIRQADVPDRPLLAPGRRLFGNPDDVFLQSQPKRGLLTSAEVRSMALAEMELSPDSIVWDVGAGSGSVAIEAAQLAYRGSVFAIEMDPDDHRLMAENIKSFGVRNVIAILGEAPLAFKDLPEPTSIFVGGQGRMVPGIVKAAFEQLAIGGRLVVNVISIENLAAVRACLDEAVGDCDVWMTNVARGTRQMDLLRFEAVNPSYVLAATKR